MSAVALRHHSAFQRRKERTGRLQEESHVNWGAEQKSSLNPAASLSLDVTGETGVHGITEFSVLLTSWSSFPVPLGVTSVCPARGSSPLHPFLVLCQGILLKPGRIAPQSAEMCEEGSDVREALITGAGGP